MSTPAASTTAAPSERKPVVARTPYEVITISLQAAGRGGFAGALAQVANVFLLMWLRTTMNYQYRYGGTMFGTIKLLYREGGVFRFYRGLVAALVQAPLARFGDTAGNVGAFTLLEQYESTRDLPIAVKTAVASCSTALFRILLMPIDAWKTTKQVEGASGLKLLVNKVRKHGISKLWYGSGAMVTATAVGHFPFFFTLNYCRVHLPQFDFPHGSYVRQALIGFMAAVASDTISNSIRVVKTTKQTAVKPLTYPQVVQEVLNKDGYLGLFGRGLKTRIFTNGLQGMLFVIFWEGISKKLDARRDAAKAK